MQHIPRSNWLSNPIQHCPRARNWFIDRTLHSIQDELRLCCILYSQCLSSWPGDLDRISHVEVTELGDKRLTIEFKCQEDDKTLTIVIYRRDERVCPVDDDLFWNFDESIDISNKAKLVNLTVTKKLQSCLHIKINKYYNYNKHGKLKNIACMYVCEGCSYNCHAPSHAEKQITMSTDDEIPTWRYYVCRNHYVLDIIHSCSFELRSKVQLILTIF